MGSQYKLRLPIQHVTHCTLNIKLYIMCLVAHKIHTICYKKKCYTRNFCVIYIFFSLESSKEEHVYESHEFFWYRIIWLEMFSLHIAFYIADPPNWSNEEKTDIGAWELVILFHSYIIKLFRSKALCTTSVFKWYVCVNLMVHNVGGGGYFPLWKVTFKKQCVFQKYRSVFNTKPNHQYTHMISSILNKLTLVYHRSCC